MREEHKANENELAKLRRHASRVHFAKIHFEKIHPGKQLDFLKIFQFVNNIFATILKVHFHI